MGEVVHSTLMPSPLSDQIKVGGEHGAGGKSYNLKKSSDDAKWLYVNLNCTCQPTEIDSQACRRNVKVDLKTTVSRTFPLTLRDSHTFACHCGSVPKGSQFQTFQTKLKDALRESVITNETQRDGLSFLCKLICTLNSLTLVTALVSYRLWTMHFCAPFLHWNLNRLRVTMFFKIIKSNGKGWFEHRLQKQSAEVKPYLSSSMLVTFLEGKIRRI